MAEDLLHLGRATMFDNDRVLVFWTVFFCFVFCFPQETVFLIHHHKSGLPFWFSAVGIHCLLVHTTLCSVKNHRLIIDTRLSKWVIGCTKKLVEVEILFELFFYS